MQEGFAIWANPSSPHGEGRKAKQALENARTRVKAALDWQGEVIFTSGASEALALGLARAKVDRRIASAVEHDAVLRAAPDMETVGIADGLIDHDALDASLQGRERVVAAVQYINSETGTVLLSHDDAGLRQRINAADSFLLSDCSQFAGVHPLPEADMIVISAHKAGGPIGVGALLVRDYAMLEPTGGHERGYRAGTENLPAILGLAAALEAGEWATTEADRRALAKRLDESDCIVQPGMPSNHVFALAHPSMSAQALLIRLDAMGFAISAGSACSSGTLKKSHVLDAFGVPDDIASRTIRVSLGWTTTTEDLERFAEVWRKLC